MTGRTEPQSGNAGLSELSYYDLVLLGLPVPLVAGLAVGELLSVPSRLGLGAGAAPSALAVGRLLFLDPPTRRGPGGRRGARESANGPSA